MTGIAELKTEIKTLEQALAGAHGKLHRLSRRQGTLGTVNVRSGGTQVLRVRVRAQVRQAW